MALANLTALGRAFGPAALMRGRHRIACARLELTAPVGTLRGR